MGLRTKRLVRSPLLVIAISAISIQKDGIY